MRARTLILVAVTLAVPAAAVAAGPSAREAGSPAARTAATANVQVGDYFFRPAYTRIEPGDTVVWRFGGGDVHTVTSRKGAPQAFDSGERLPGQQFSRAFPTAGRYPYLCELHPDEMRGTVQVGPDTVDPKVAKPKATVGAKSVRISFQLSETSKASVTIASTAKPKKALRRVRAKQLQDGRRAVSIKTAGLAPGRYRATVSAKDPEGNVGTARVAFRIQ